MQNIIKTAQYILSIIGGALSVFIGGWDGLIVALVVFVTLDYILGVTIAIMQKKLSSDIGFKGIVKKVLIFALVGVGHTIDTHVLGGGQVLRTAVIFYYISNEGISVLENCAVVGLPIPEQLRDVLIQLREKKTEDNDGNS